MFFTELKFHDIFKLPVDKKRKILSFKIWCICKTDGDMEIAYSDILFAAVDLSYNKVPWLVLDLGN